MKITEQQKQDLAEALSVGWKAYVALFGEPPRGTIQDFRALFELTPLEKLRAAISKAEASK